MKNLQLEEGRYPQNYFDYVINIGAYKGFFIEDIIKLHPNARIIGYEPSIESFQQLAIKTKDMEGVSIVNQALGDGSHLFFKDTGRDNSSMFVEEDVSTYKIKSVTLPDIISDCEVDLNKKVAIAMNCEGGERFMLDDPGSVEVIKNCEHFAMDTHFRHDSNRNVHFNLLPEWERYNDWIQENFKDTNDIIYWKSSRKRGHGFYILRKKT